MKKSIATLLTTTALLASPAVAAQITFDHSQSYMDAQQAKYTTFYKAAKQIEATKRFHKVTVGDQSIMWEFAVDDHSASKLFWGAEFLAPGEPLFYTGYSNTSVDKMAYINGFDSTEEFFTEVVLNADEDGLDKLGVSREQVASGFYAQDAGFLAEAILESTMTIAEVIEANGPSPQEILAWRMKEHFDQFTVQQKLAITLGRFNDAHELPEDFFEGIAPSLIPEDVNEWVQGAGAVYITSTDAEIFKGVVKYIEEHASSKVRERLQDLEDNLAATSKDLSDHKAAQETVDSGQNTNISSNATDISTEVARAKAAEVVLTDDLASEVTARSNADTAIRSEFATEDTNIRSEFATADTNITTAYTTADSTLQTNITAEETARIAEDAKIRAEFKQADIDNLAAIRDELADEVSDLEAADVANLATLRSELQAAINAEVEARDAAILSEETARIAADAIVQADVDANEADADAAIASLHTALTDEALARSVADTGLSADIVSEAANRAAGDARLQGIITSLTGWTNEDADNNPTQIRLRFYDGSNQLHNVTVNVGHFAGDAEVEAIRVALQDAIDSGDAELTAAIAELDAAYKAADVALQANIEAEVANRISAIASEEAARIAVDVAIQADVDANEAASDAAIAAVQANVDANEADADSSIASLISDLADEVARALGIENDLRTDLTAETAAREAADTTLQANIDAEEAARVTADNTLQANINAEGVSRLTAVSNLETAISSEEAARIAADATLTDNLAALTTKVDVDITNAISTLETTVNTTITNQISTLETTVNGTIATAVSNLEAADTTLQSNINALSADIYGFAGAELDLDDLNSANGWSFHMTSHSWGDNHYYTHTSGAQVVHYPDEPVTTFNYTTQDGGAGVTVYSLEEAIALIQADGHLPPAYVNGSVQDLEAADEAATADRAAIREEFAAADEVLSAEIELTRGAGVWSTNSTLTTGLANVRTDFGAADSILQDNIDAVSTAVDMLTTLVNANQTSNLEALSVINGQITAIETAAGELSALVASNKVDTDAAIVAASLAANTYADANDSDTQLSDADIAAFGYIKSYVDTNTQLTDAEITALGYIKSYVDTNTQLTDAEIAALGYIKVDTNTQLSDADIAALGYIKTYVDTNTQLTDADITALGYIKTYIDTNTQLTDAEITALGYIKSYTDTNTQLSDADIAGFGYIKSYTDTNTQLSDSDIAGFGYIKSVDLSAYSTTADVNALITAAVSDFVTESDIDSKISTAIATSEATQAAKDDAQDARITAVEDRLTAGGL